MEARLQRRIQRDGWDRAARDYERRWQAQLASAHAQLLAYAALAPGERVLSEVRRRVRTRYLQAIAPWQRGTGYRIPAEFVVVAAAVPEAG